MDPSAYLWSERELMPYIFAVFPGSGVSLDEQFHSERGYRFTFKYQANLDSMLRSDCVVLARGGFDNDSNKAFRKTLIASIVAVRSDKNIQLGDFSYTKIMAKRCVFESAKEYLCKLKASYDYVSAESKEMGNLFCSIADLIDSRLSALPNLASQAARMRDFGCQFKARCIKVDDDVARDMMDCSVSDETAQFLNDCGLPMVSFKYCVCRTYIMCLFFFCTSCMFGLRLGMILFLMGSVYFMCCRSLIWMFRILSSNTSLKRLCKESMAMCPLLMCES